MRFPAAKYAKNVFVAPLGSGGAYSAPLAGFKGAYF